MKEPQTKYWTLYGIVNVEDKDAFLMSDREGGKMCLFSTLEHATEFIRNGAIINGKFTYNPQDKLIIIPFYLSKELPSQCTTTQSKKPEKTVRMSKP